jgi:hypothetical protein
MIYRISWRPSIERGNIESDGPQLSFLGVEPLCRQSAWVISSVPQPTADVAGSSTCLGSG